MSVDVLDVGKFTFPVISFRQIVLLLDYEKNYIKFYLFRESAVLERVVNGVIVARKEEELKRAVETGSGLKLEVDYTLNELSFRINVGLQSYGFEYKHLQCERAVRNIQSITDHPPNLQQCRRFGGFLLTAYIIKLFFIIT